MRVSPTSLIDPGLPSSSLRQMVNHYSDQQALDTLLVIILDLIGLLQVSGLHRSVHSE